MPHPPRPGDRTVIPGEIEVECRLVVTVQCPACGQEHRYLLGQDDYLGLRGMRLWPYECGGTTFLIKVPARVMARGLAQAQRISARHQLPWSHARSGSWYW